MVFQQKCTDTSPILDNFAHYHAFYLSTGVLGPIQSVTFYLKARSQVAIQE